MTVTRQRSTPAGVVVDPNGDIVPYAEVKVLLAELARSQMLHDATCFDRVRDLLLGYVPEAKS